MIYWSHHFDLVEKGESVARIGGVDSVDFRESLDCKLLAICYPLYLINGGESSLSEFFDRFEQLMKSHLIYVFVEEFQPNTQQILTYYLQLQSLHVFLCQLEANRFGKDRIRSRVSQVVPCIEYLELEIKAHGSVIAVLLVETPLIAERNAVRCESKIDFLFKIFVEPECWVYIDIVSPDFPEDFFGDG